MALCLSLAAFQVFTRGRIWVFGDSAGHRLPESDLCAECRAITLRKLIAYREYVAAAVELDGREESDSLSSHSGSS